MIYDSFVENGQKECLDMHSGEMNSFIGISVN